MTLHLFANDNETWVAETVEQAHARTIKQDPMLADEMTIDDWVAIDDGESITAGECDSDGTETKLARDWAKDFGEVGALFGDWC